MCELAFYVRTDTVISRNGMTKVLCVIHTVSENKPTLKADHFRPARWTITLRLTRLVVPVENCLSHGSM